MYKLSAMTLAAMFAAGVLVGDPASVDADTKASAGVLVTRSSTSDFLYGTAPVAAPEAAAVDPSLSESDALRIALRAGDEIRAERAGQTVSGVRTMEAIFAAPDKAAPVTDDAWKVTGNWVNLRAGPGTGHAVVTQAGLGDVLEPLSDPSGEWVQVRLSDGREAWIFSKYLAPAG